MTDQETYDIVKKHLLCQMKHSKTGYSCRYRGDNGLKCALGALIPDEKYGSEMDGQIYYIDDLIVDLGLTQSPDFLGKLQSIHDGYMPEEWAARLSAFAADRGLHD